MDDSPDALRDSGPQEVITSLQTNNPDVSFSGRPGLFYFHTWNRHDEAAQRHAFSFNDGASSFEPNLDVFFQLLQSICLRLALQRFR